MDVAKQNRLIVIVGPTGVGKTHLSIVLTKRFKTEIISADSRQFYREIEIGTAKPNAEELSAVPHHLINSLSIQDNYSVGDFEKQALSIVADLHKVHATVIMVGGSGLYVDAVCYGLDQFPTIVPKFREELNEEYAQNGLEPLQKELLEKDPEYYAIVDLKNPQRVIRALEVVRGSGRHSLRSGKSVRLKGSLIS